MGVLSRSSFLHPDQSGFQLTWLWWINSQKVNISEKWLNYPYFYNWTFREPQKNYIQMRVKQNHHQQNTIDRMVFTFPCLLSRELCFLELKVFMEKLPVSVMESSSHILHIKLSVEQQQQQQQRLEGINNEIQPYRWSWGKVVPASPAGVCITVTAEFADEVVTQTGSGQSAALCRHVASVLHQNK